MSVNAPARRLQLSLAAISAAVVAYQLALMQILSLVQWHHFAYMIIAVALLGFGAAGTFLTLMRSWLTRHFTIVIPVLCCLSGAAMAQITEIAQSSWVRFDSLLLFTGMQQFLRLFLTYGLYFLPFFFAALAIGMIFVHAAEEIGRLYFWNLIGSGVGGVVMAGLPWLFMPSVLPALSALAAVAAALLVLPEALRGPRFPCTEIGEQSRPPSVESANERPGQAPERYSGGCRRGILVATVVVSALMVLISLIRPPILILSEFKDLSRTLLLPDARITHEQNSPYGLLQAVSSPVLRYAPGLSLVYQGPVPVAKAVFNNGDWLGAIVPRQGEDSKPFLDFTTSALPYDLDARRRVLLLDAGTGALLPQALSKGAEQVSVVESHPAILALLRKEQAGEAGFLFDRPSVLFSSLSSRTFLSVVRAQYDLIVLPTVDVFGGTSGQHAITEQYLLTREGFRQIWRKLTSPGVISVTCWMDYPVRHPLKILATLAEALEAEGIGNVRAHLAAVRGWGAITIVAKKTPLNADDSEKIRRFCGRLLFDPFLLPDLRIDERMRYNGLQDDRFFAYVDEILSPSRERFYADYPFNIRPATDNSPYFSQFLRWRSIGELVRLYGSHTVPFLEVGYLLVLLTLLQVFVAAVVLIVLPLRVLRHEGGARVSTLLYFGGCGIGYMFAEVVLIQRFLLYFGNPLYAAAVVISGMLVCSGIGSLLSARWIRSRRRASAVITSIILSILLYAGVMTPVLQATIGLPPALKWVLALLFIAPLALLMGTPFPLGIRLLARSADQEVPWAWGINGCLSVVSTVLAAFVAVELGYAWVMTLAAMAYGVTLWGGMMGLFRPEGFRHLS